MRIRFVTAAVLSGPHEIEAMGFSLPLDSKNRWTPFNK